MSNLQDYGDAFGSYTQGAATDEGEDLERAGSGHYMKLAVGKTVIRILPPPSGRSSPFITVHEHFIRIPGKERPAVFACPRVMKNQPCPVCSRANELRISPNSADQKRAEELWPSRRVYMNVIDRGDEEAGPKILGVGKTIHAALVAARTAEADDEVGHSDYTHPTEGSDIIVKRVGTTFKDTKYTVTVSPRTSELGDPEWLHTRPDLRQKLVVPTAEEIIAMCQPDNPEDASDALPPAGGGAIEAHRAASHDAGTDPYGDDRIPF
jgi:hypothetical protein